MNPTRTLPLDASQRLAAAEAYLFRRFNFERFDASSDAAHRFRLETIRRLLERFDHPHLSYPVIHVAGTKGKGSVVSMIASILSAAGRRVGVYRSPHLETVRERISIGDAWIGPSAFAEVIESLQPAIAELDRESESAPQLHPPTFFDIVTAAAFLYFRQQQVDAVVLEVGLGGRLDSTNICAPLLTIITNIGLDHQRQLGNTKALIAAEKAGIVKSGVPLLCGIREPSPAQVVRMIASERGAPAYWCGQDFGARHTGRTTEELTFTAWGEQPSRYLLRGLHTALYGHHQVDNASLAVAAAVWLDGQGWAIDADAIRRGLHQVQLAGRFQLFASTPPIVVDVAHNAMSARVFAAAIRARFPTACQRTLIFSASKDKRIGPMLRALLTTFDRLILTLIRDNPRAADLATLHAAADQALRELDSRGQTSATTVEVCSDQAAALELACGARPDLVAVCGSVFLAGQMLPALRSWANSMPGSPGS